MQGLLGLRFSLHSLRKLQRAVREGMVAGLSTRNYRQAVESVLEGYGIEKSSVSRQFVDKGLKRANHRFGHMNSPANLLERCVYFRFTDEALAASDDPSRRDRNAEQAYNGYRAMLQFIESRTYDRRTAGWIEVKAANAGR